MSNAYNGSTLHWNFRQFWQWIGFSKCRAKKSCYIIAKLNVITKFHYAECRSATTFWRTSTKVQPWFQNALTCTFNLASYSIEIVVIFLTISIDLQLWRRRKWFGWSVKVSPYKKSWQFHKKLMRIKRSSLPGRRRCRPAWRRRAGSSATWGRSPSNPWPPS